MTSFVGAIGRVLGSRSTSVRVVITCEVCGYRHPLERTIHAAGEISILCHRCEVPLIAVVERRRLKLVQGR